MFKTLKNKNSGFSYIETIIGISILASIALSLFALFDLTLRIIWENKARIGAHSIATEKLETIRNMPYDSVGTDGGIPSGSLPQTETVTKNGISYTVNTTILYIDDSYDGTLGGSPEDLLSTDYKKVRISVSWNSRLDSDPVVYVTNISPKGMETSVGGGTLRINTINASGAPVGQANVKIENSSITPEVDVSLLSDNSGKVLLPGAKASVEGYRVVVDKAGYSTDETYDPIIPDMPTSARPRLTVMEGSVTDATFVIDLLSSMDIYSLTIREYNPSWWNTDYKVRRRLNIINQSSSKTLPSGYSVKFDFDHYSEVQQGDALASGDDVRLLWYDGTNWQELDRVAETSWNNSSAPTEIWFKTKSSIAAGGSDSNYFLYYKNSTPSTPLADRRNVYSFWDDFSDPSYTYSNWSTSTNTWVVSSGKYVQSSSSGATQAWAGSAMTDYLVKADMQATSGQANIGMVGRRKDDGNYAVARSALFPKQIAQSDFDFNVFGYRSMVQATDGTMAIFTASTTSFTYRMYVSSDNGANWQVKWENNVLDGMGMMGHSAWLDPDTNEILFVYTRYVSTTDDYQVRLIRFAYNSSQKTWTASGSPQTIAAYGYSTRPYNPQVVKLSSGIAVSYVRYQTDNKNEIAVKMSPDNGVNWSTESWISSFNTSFNSQEISTIRGDLIVYNNQIAVVLNGARNISWRLFNGVNWLTTEQITTNTYQNDAFSVLIDKPGSGQNLYVIYRHNSDSGKLHLALYDGSSWTDTVIVDSDVEYEIASTIVDTVFSDDLFVFYKLKNKDDIYMKRYTSSSWEEPVVVYKNSSDTGFMTTLRYDLVSGSIHLFYVSNSANPYFYYHNIGMYGTVNSTPSVLMLRENGSDNDYSLLSTDLSLNKNISLKVILESTSVQIYTDNSLTFFDKLPITVDSGVFGLYTNSTSAEFDNVLSRLYISPEPTVTGNLEEVYEESQPLPNLPFRIYGSKVKGYDSNSNPVYKFDYNLTTDSTGKYATSSIEWDSYNFFVATSTGYDISAIDPPDPVSLLPGTNKQVNIYLVSDELHTLRVVVVDANGNPVEDATVRLQNSSLSYDKTITTPSHGQAFFSPLSNSSYNLTVSKTGYNSFTDTLSVKYISTFRVVLYEEGTSPPSSPPQAPTITSFTNVTETSMTVNWSDNANNEDGYKVYYNTINSKPATPVATLSANSTSYQILGLSCGTTYYVWVEAYNTQGEASDTSSQATSSCPSPPQAPTITSFTNVTETSMTVNWSDNANNEDGYKVYYNTINSKPATPVATLSANSTSYQILGLSCGTTYYVWVEAYNTQGEASDTSSQATSGCSPSVFFFDSFTESSDTTLSSHTPDTGSGWTLLISIDNGNPVTDKTLKADGSDRLDRESCSWSDGALYRINDTITSADYEVSVVQLNGDSWDDFNILSARIQDSNNMYAAKWNEMLSYIYKKQNGTWTIISGPTSGISDGSTVTLKVQGNSISLLDDGVTKLSATDSSFTQAGYAGVGMGAVITPGDDCSAQKLDNFQVLITN